MLKVEIFPLNQGHHHANLLHNQHNSQHKIMEIWVLMLDRIKMVLKMLTRYIIKSTIVTVNQHRTKLGQAGHNKSKGDNFRILILKSQVYNGIIKV